MTRRTRYAALIAAAALAAGSAACGTSDPASTATAPAASAPATESPKAFLDPETEAAYLAALRRIDPGIVGDKKPATLVSRGRSQCDSIERFPDDEKKLVDLTSQRFTAPDHPDGFGEAKAKKILAAVRKYVCPEVGS
ncbi:hypothetical protein MED01_002467 [Micromonospora sp. MED01]|uniref:hypothetical protein n=1 Tax=Micromonospora alfalfae TaxID=2911212 RepID=UPI001EE78550|nr:hypothetical protein [Micromonospora alfalfae]MCG5464301.1 hypothetical protein [Micromonospora alfalfae]